MSGRIEFEIELGDETNRSHESQFIFRESAIRLPDRSEESRAQIFLAADKIEDVAGFAKRLNELMVRAAG